MDSLTLKHHNSYQNQNNRKVTLALTSRSLTFKLKQEVFIFSYNWPGVEFFKLRKLKFRESYFS